MERWFGDPVDEGGPIRFLEAHGYTLLENWCWRKPVPSHTVSGEEVECIMFLIHEWDFGGLG
jgi:hypothetical protein